MIENSSYWQLRLKDYLRQFDDLCRPAHLSAEEKLKGYELLSKMMQCLARIKETL